MSLECDDAKEHGPQTSLDLAIEIFGPPTTVVESGGIWVDPITGAAEPKVHAHWRLCQTTKTPEQHKQLREVRVMAARLLGADATAGSSVHPLRCPGSWHKKAEPRMARIRHIDNRYELELPAAYARVCEIYDAVGWQIRRNKPAVERPTSPEAHSELQQAGVCSRRNSQ